MELFLLLAASTYNITRRILFGQAGAIPVIVPHVLIQVRHTVIFSDIIQKFVVWRKMKKINNVTLLTQKQPSAAD